MWRAERELRADRPARARVRALPALALQLQEQLPLLLRPLIAASDTVSYTSTLFLPKNDVCCMTKRNLAKDGGKKHGTLSMQSPRSEERRVVKECRSRW